LLFFQNIVSLIYAIAYYRLYGLNRFLPSVWIYGYIIQSLVNGIDICLNAGFYNIGAYTTAGEGLAVLLHLYGAFTQCILAAGYGTDPVILQGNLHAYS